jgi:hypothetical protein
MRGRIRLALFVWQAHKGIVKRRRTAALFLLAVLVLGLGRWLFTSAQPYYQGRSLDSWLRDLDYNSARGVLARGAIRQMGTNALPVLMQHLAHHDSFWMQRFWGFLQLHGIWNGSVSAFVESDFEWHRRAAEGLRELGPAAAPALRLLAEGVTNSQAPEQVVDALCAMVPRSTCVLTNVVVTCRQNTARSKAVEGLEAACRYDEAAQTSIVGLDFALKGYPTEGPAVRALLNIRDGDYPLEIRQLARERLEKYSLAKRLEANSTNGAGSELKKRYGQ